MTNDTRKLAHGLAWITLALMIALVLIWLVDDASPCQDGAPTETIVAERHLTLLPPLEQTR